jgi:hypothetical protein
LPAPAWIGAGVDWRRRGLAPAWIGAGVGWRRRGLAPAWIGAGVDWRRRGLAPVAIATSAYRHDGRREGGRHSAHDRTPDFIPFDPFSRVETASILFQLLSLDARPGWTRVSVQRMLDRPLLAGEIDRFYHSACDRTQNDH